MTITAYILLRDYESVIRRSCSSLEFETETGVYLIGLRSTDLAVRWYSRPPERARRLILSPSGC